MNILTQRMAIAAAVVLALGGVNASIFSKERIKTQGTQIYLRLAPVDPRSLMQGDYMALRFAVVADVDTSASGYLPLRLDSQRIATLADDPTKAQVRMRYRIRNNQVWLGTNAYFFEEGTAERYSRAVFGEFRVDADSGEGVLVGLRNEKLERL